MNNHFNAEILVIQKFWRGRKTGLPGEMPEGSKGDVNSRKMPHQTLLRFFSGEEHN